MSDTINYLTENMISYNSVAAEETKQIKPAAARLFRLTVVNTNAAARFLWVFDNASADLGTPVCPPMPLGTAAAPTPVDMAWGYGKKCLLGLRVHSSSTQATFTASASNDLLIAASYL